jgi:hypothetical protein
VGQPSTIVLPGFDAQTLQTIAPEFRTIFRQTLKGGNIMKSKLLVAGLLLFGGVISTHAQSGGVYVRVPFEFEIANKTLPAGEYVVSSEHDQVWVRAYHGNTVAVVQSNRIEHEDGKTGKVLFNCYEKHCFLSQLRMPDSVGSREIPISKSEKLVAMRAEAQQFALLARSVRLDSTN